MLRQQQKQSNSSPMASATATSSNSSSNSSAAASATSSPGLLIPPSSSSSSTSIAPKILLAKPGSTSSAESSANLRSRLPLPGSLNLLSDSWDFHIDRILPFLTENTDFKVIGVIGTPGSGKSTIMNELYGFFDGTSSGMLPPFATQSEETKAMAKHCTAGIELRISTDRLILLDTQPVFSPSVLAEMTRPDGSSTISLLNGATQSADLAHELIGIQVDLLKHGIPDPSSLTPSYSQSSNIVTEKELINQRTVEDHLASLVFVHTNSKICARLQDQELAPLKSVQLRKTLAQYFTSSSFMGLNHGGTHKDQIHPAGTPDINIDGLGSREPSLVLLPYKNQDDVQGAQYESFTTVLGKLRDQVSSMNFHSFSKSVSEREWLRNSARIWENAKSSPVFAEYSRMLQSSGMFRS